METLKRRDVKLIVVSSFRPNYRQFMEREVLHLAIVPRLDTSPPSAERSRTVRERFDQE